MFIDSSLTLNKSIFVSMNTETLPLMCNNIQLMYSFEVNIRIFQTENSNIHQDEAKVNIIFEC